MVLLLHFKLHIVFFFSITYQVLQRSMDMELELVGVGGKVGAAAGQPVAKLTITGLASTPVDHDTKNNNTLLITGKYIIFLNNRTLGKY